MLFIYIYIYTVHISQNQIPSSTKYAAMISCAFPQLSIAWQNARWPASAAACATGATGLGSIVEVNVEPLT